MNFNRFQYVDFIGHGHMVTSPSPPAAPLGRWTPALHRRHVWGLRHVAMLPPRAFSVLMPLRILSEDICLAPSGTIWHQQIISEHVKKKREKCEKRTEAATTRPHNFLQGTRLQLLPASPAARTRCGWCDLPRFGHGPFRCHFLTCIDM